MLRFASSPCRAVATLVLVASALPARAHDEPQVGLRVDAAANRLVTRAYFGGGYFSSDERVFAAEFAVVGGQAVSDEPAFAAPADTFTAAGEVRIALTKPVEVWAGSFFVPFDLTLSVEDPFTGAVARSPSEPTTPDAAPAFALAVAPGAMLMQHFDFTLSGPGGRLVPNGIYLAEGVALAPDLGVGASEPFWIVMNLGRPHEEHDAAKIWARENLVPTPGTALLAVLGTWLLAPGRARQSRTA